MVCNENAVRMLMEKLLNEHKEPFSNATRIEKFLKVYFKKEEEDKSLMRFFGQNLTLESHFVSLEDAKKERGEREKFYRTKIIPKFAKFIAVIDKKIEKIKKKIADIEEKIEYK